MKFSLRLTILQITKEKYSSRVYFVSGSCIKKILSLHNKINGKVIRCLLILFVCRYSVSDFDKIEVSLRKILY